LQAAEKLISSGKKCQGTTSQVAEKLVWDRLKRQGTTLVVPKMQQNKGRALAPAGCYSEFLQEDMPFSAASLAVSPQPASRLARRHCALSIPTFRFITTAHPLGGHRIS
jgi:hypothetical protein